MADLLNLIGAGLKDAYIKDSNGETYDIYAVVEMDSTPETDEVEVKGDDSSLGTFFFNRKETLTIRANGLSFDVIQAITGNTATKSASSTEIGVGEDNEDNPPYVEVGGTTMAKDTDGNECELKKVYHKVQLTSPNVAQSGESEFTLELTGVAYQTDKDIEGASLDSTRVATISGYQV